jgi:hypothetical protein
VKGPPFRTRLRVKLPDGPIEVDTVVLSTCQRMITVYNIATPSDDDRPYFLETSCGMV